MNGLRLSNPAMLAVSAQGAFDPLTLSPSIWKDASREAYANNDPATTAHDYSGNARDFLEASSPPIFKTGVLNGKPGFYFNGSKQLIRSYAGSGTSFTIAGVVSRDDDAFRLWWVNGIDPYFGLQTNRRPSFYQGSSVQSIYPEIAGDIDEASLIGVISDNGETKVILGRNIVAVGSTTPSPLKVGGISSLGGYQWLGYLHEDIATETALSYVDWNNYEAYVREKWGLANRHRLVIDGTSINFGVGASVSSNSWAEIVRSTLSSTLGVTNTAISGQTISDCTGAGGPAEFCSLNAASFEWTGGRRTDGKNILIIDAPTNDAFYGKTAAESLAAYSAYCQGAQAAGYFVIVSTMLDRNPAGGSWTRLKQIDINTSIRADWATFADALIDPLTADVRFDDWTSAVFADGIHPNDTGHSILASLYIAAINSANLS